MHEPQRRISQWFGGRRPVRLMLLAALLALGVIHSQTIFQGLLVLIRAVSPLAVGLAIAYMLDIIADRIEKNLFPGSRNIRLIQSRRMLAIGLSVILVLMLLVLLFWIVLPGLAEAVTLLTSELPGYFESVKAWILENFGNVPAVAEFVEPLEFDWNVIQNAVIRWVSMGAGSEKLISSTVSVLSSLLGGMGNLMISMIFALFLLSGEKTILRQVNRLLRAALKKNSLEKLMHVLRTANRTISGFIIGQTVYGLISGISTWICMLIFGMPYALMVGVLCGTLIIIPAIGGYLGGALGAFLVFTVSPSMAVWFLLFIIVLQTVEGNLIYPRLVGSSIGMPGMWVLAAVTLGGGIAGMGGMLIAVPLAATVYALLREWVQKKESLSGGMETPAAEQNILPADRKKA